MGKGTIIILAVFVILSLSIGVVTGYSAEKVRSTATIESYKADMQKQLSVAATTNQTTPPPSNSFNTITSVNDDSLFLDLSTKIVSLNPIASVSGTGRGYVLRKTGKLFIKISVNLSDPSPNNHYEGYLVKDGAHTDVVIPLGSLVKQKNGSYQLSYSSDTTYDTYSILGVVLDPGVIGPQPYGKPVLGGPIPN